MNGTHAKSILLRQIDDTYIFIKECEIITLSPTDFTKAHRIIREHGRENNVYIDSRMEYIILIAAYKYGDVILIYDYRIREIITLYEYLTSRYTLPPSCLTSEFIKSFAVCILFLHVFLCENIKVNLSNMIRVLRKQKNKGYFTTSILIDIIGKSWKKRDSSVSYHREIANFFNSLANFSDIIPLKNFYREDILETLTEEYVISNK